MAAEKRSAHRTFWPQLGELDLHLFAEGRHWNIHQPLGAQLKTLNGVEGVLFAVWAPSATRVSVVGSFNNWNGLRHPMRALGGSGVWELFIPGLHAGDLYKFEIRNEHTGDLLLKTDPNDCPHLIQELRTGITIFQFRG